MIHTAACQLVTAPSCFTSSGAFMEGHLDKQPGLVFGLVKCCHAGVVVCICVEYM